MAKILTLNRAQEDRDLLLAAFADSLAGQDKGKSAAAYVGDMDRFARWIAGKYGIFDSASVSTLDVVEYRAYLQSQKGYRGKSMAAATVNRSLVSLRVFFEWLKTTGQVKDNPAAGVKQVATANRPAPKWLNRNEQAALIHAVQDGGNLRDMAMIGTMLHAGLRVSELCNLDRPDIEISDRKGTVRVTGKGNKVRVVPLNKTVRKMLSDWLEINREGPLFPNRYGKPMGRYGVEEMVGEYADRAKPKLDMVVTPHTLRHVFCKNLIDMGVPLDQVAMLAGHASLDVTKLYTAPSMADLQAAVDRAARE